MKFYLCGGLDAPDWTLAEIATLSKVSSVRTKLLVVHVIRHILEGVFDYSKVERLITDSSVGASDLKACVALVHFIVTSAAKFNLNEDILSKELQQLGLPKEHSNALCVPFHDKKDELQAKLLQQSFKIDALSVCGWQVRVGSHKAVLIRLASKELEEKQVLVYAANGTLICTTPEKLRILLHELKTLRSFMGDNL
eukprot:c16974_g1_i3 orf=127-714(-)